MKECCFILFGATGDLAMRKIFPSLYQIYLNPHFKTQIKIIASARTELNNKEFQKELIKKAKIHIKDINEKKWEQFLSQIEYLSLNLEDKTAFLSLKQKSEKSKNIVVYFSIAPEFFIQTCKNLALASLNDTRVKIVLEKPLGIDLASCKAIHKELEKYYKEKQIYRIDHYLGKESVQNLLFLRTQNLLFQNIWNNKYINYVEISVFETLGVENRGGFYDKVGALRDMLQNHMLQILSLIAMDIPKKLNFSNLRKAKCKLLKALKSFDAKALKQNLIRAQYTQNQGLKAYVNEALIKPQSQTETFVALKLFIENKTWQGVPFYLRTGKRMAKQFAQVVLHFKDENKLILCLQPQNSIILSLKAKKEGEQKSKFANLKRDLSYNTRQTQAYESLIMQVINGDLSSFNHKEELEAAWLFLEPILKYLKEASSPLYYYPAKTWGPKEADTLLAKEHHWHKP